MRVKRARWLSFLLERLRPRMRGCCRQGAGRPPPRPTPWGGKGVLGYATAVAMLVTADFSEAALSVFSHVKVFAPPSPGLRPKWPW